MARWYWEITWSCGDKMSGIGWPTPNQEGDLLSCKLHPDSYFVSSKGKNWKGKKDGTKPA